MSAPAPRLRRRYALVVHDADRVELRDGVWNPTAVSVVDESGSGLLAQVVERLDGTLAPGEIAADLGAPVADVEAVVAHLDQQGVLERGPESYLDVHLDAVEGRAARSAPARPVLVAGDEDLAGTLAGLLRVAAPDLRVDQAGPGHPLQELDAAGDAWADDGLELHRTFERFGDLRGKLVVYAERVIDPLRAELVNRVCLHHGVPWLHAAVDGPFVLVGPLVVPRETACWHCYETRVLMNLRERASYQQYKRALARGAVRPGDAGLRPLLGALLAAHAAPEVLAFATTDQATLAGHVLAIYLPTSEISVSEVLRLPACPACGSVPERDDEELYFDLRALGGPIA